MRIGVDLGGTKIEAIALDGGREVGRIRVATPRGDYEGTLDAVEGAVRELESRLPDTPSRSATVGIGIPGTITPNGEVKNANSTWLIGKPLLQDIEARLGRPVRIANDANCFAMSEVADGAAAGAAVVFGVIVGTGVGGGIVVHGEVITGANGVAGEWGHNPLPWAERDEVPGPVCYCGRRGCIETFLSGPALSLDHERATGERLSPPDIAARAAAGEGAADETMKRYEHRMARALAAVVNVLDPDVIVLGGGVSNVARLYVNVPPVLARYVFAAEKPAAIQAATRVLPARHGDASGVRGAAWLWPLRE